MFPSKGKVCGEPKRAQELPKKATSWERGASLDFQKWSFCQNVSPVVAILPYKGKVCGETGKSDQERDRHLVIFCANFGRISKQR